MLGHVWPVFARLSLVRTEYSRIYQIRTG